MGIGLQHADNLMAAEPRLIPLPTYGHVLKGRYAVCQSLLPFKKIYSTVNAVTVPARAYLTLE